MMLIRVVLKRPLPTDTIMLNYTGKLLTKKADGKESIFDSSIEKTAKEAGIHNPMAKYGPRAFTLGAAIPGFNEGIQLVGKGGKILLIIPSNWVMVKVVSLRLKLHHSHHWHLRLKSLIIKNLQQMLYFAVTIAPPAPTTVIISEIA